MAEFGAAGGAADGRLERLHCRGGEGTVSGGLPGRTGEPAGAFDDSVGSGVKLFGRD